MGVELRGVCYPDAASAFNAYRSGYPTSPDANGVSWSFQSFDAPSVWWAGGYMSTVHLAKSDGTSGSMLVFMGNCSADTSNLVLDKYPIQDVLFAAAFIFAAFIGFAMGRKK